MILYISPIPTAFIQRDIEMLSPTFRIVHLNFTANPYLLPFFFVIQFLQLMILLPFTKKYLCFFAGYHTIIPVFLGRLFNKEVIIECGGTDAMHLPKIDYGNYRKEWLKKATVYSFKNCSLILPVSHSLVKSTYTYDAESPRLQGLLHLIPDLKTEIQVVYNGFDDQFWTDDQRKKSPFSFVTVATGISKKNRALVKGIDLVLELAKVFPSYSFTIIGDENFQTTLPNVTVMQSLSQKKIREVYRVSQFYLQLSYSEGFPNALAEAMLCGCVPIGSDVGEIAKIIGETGFILPKKDFSLLHSLVSKLHQIDLEILRINAVLRVKENFNYTLRKEKLIAILK
ncbi:glycosyltransferase family 4 protein [uncultured Cyclobacterium sp.]|uniref:glycosyltransferase family 4 protein n=1 Tax=uncultured Cyclobacterium sp. TaxID=453820 RepID=UPI0030EBDDA8|tara:strand:+ start:24405 stop:25427 length:1023 start_codon:yes stop_codon:yes gene_type:complete